MNPKTATFVIGALLIAFVVFAAVTQKSATDVRTFSSNAELEAFLGKNTDGSYSGYARETAAGGSVKSSLDSTQAPASPGANGYSQTNVQVAGVDEPDFVKNTDKFIYIGRDTNLTIIDAYPAENAAIRAVINVNGSINAILEKDDHIVVFGTDYNAYMPIDPLAKIASFAPIYRAPRSFLKIYDVHDPTQPTLVNEVFYDGTYQDARLIGSYVYMITNQPLIREGNDIVLPTIEQDGTEESIAATDIRYFPMPDYGYQLTTVFALNLEDRDTLTHASFLTGYTQTLYVSENNIYLTATKYVPYDTHEQKMLADVIVPALSGDARDDAEDILDSDSDVYTKQREIQDVVARYYNELSEDDKRAFENDLADRAQEFESDWQKETQKTVIHKIHLAEDEITYEGQGELTGYLLNQFSLDEHNGYLRVATTTSTWSGPMFYAAEISARPTQPQTANHVYILDEDLDIVGSLEDLAPEETIYSVRFIGDRAYMVTFKQVDPLFVLDLADPQNPRVLGTLKIPGFSTYLHPFDETHLIGIGQDTDGEVDEGGFNATIPAGLKIALFDITDPSNPQELDRYIVGDRGTYSDALYDHKAFLFNHDTGLLVLPVSVQARIPSQPNEFWYPTTTVFEGVYVFHVTTDGIDLTGRLTHLNTTEQSDMEKARGGKEYYYPPYDAHIQRSLYIGNTLYTISQRAVHAHDLETLDQRASIRLPIAQPVYYVAYGGAGVDDAVAVSEPAASR